MNLLLHSTVKIDIERSISDARFPPDISLIVNFDNISYFSSTAIGSPLLHSTAIREKKEITVAALQRRSKAKTSTERERKIL